MSFGGAVSAMITSLKNNKRERKSMFEKKNTSGHYSNHIPFVDHKKPSPEKLKELQLKIR